MTTRYVVCVKPPDDHPAEIKVYGPWRDLTVATNFCESVRKACDAADAKLPTPDIRTGYAWVMLLNGPRTNDAKRFAVTGSEIAA